MKNLKVVFETVLDVFLSRHGCDVSDVSEFNFNSKKKNIYI